MKKILSLILVLAMLLGMTSLQVFAADDGITLNIGTSAIWLDIDETYTAEATVSGDDADASKVHWSIGNSTVATISENTGNDTTVTGIAEGKTTLSAYYDTEGNHEKSRDVYVYDESSFEAKYSVDSIAFKKTDSAKTVTATKSYDTTNSTFKAAALDKATIKYEVIEGTDKVTVTSTGSIAPKKVGTATIKATCMIGTTPVGTSDTIEVTVFDLDLSYEVENYSDLEIDRDELVKDIEAELATQGETSVDIDRLTITIGDHTLGKLSQIAGEDFKFEAKKWAIGKDTYSFTAKDGSAEYKGTLTFDIQPYEEIDDEISATFSKNEFYLDVPAGLDYMKIVSSEADFEGAHTTRDKEMYADDKFIFNPGNYSSKISGGKLELYVVGLDGDYASAGKITITGLDADIFYLGEVDSETTFDADDFEDLYDAIYLETATSDEAYTEFEKATFTYSKNNNYKLYNDGKDMTTSALKTVKLDDLDSVSVEPLKSGEYIIDVDLVGKVYSSSKSSGTSKTYKAAIKVSALEGDVEYTANAGTTFYLDELDFSAYYIDATKSSSARLNYITLKDTDVKYATISVPKSATSASYEYYDGQKLYTEEKAGTRDLLIDDAKITVAKTVANGTKIYIPFTANGTKSTKSGYIEITVGAKAPAYTFTDVVSGSWYYNPVQWACANEITKGTSSTTFSPNLGCTRAQAVTFLYRAYLAAGGTKYSSTTTGFTDVDKTKHADYLTAIAWAKANGVTSGTSATTFGPDKVCTRAQIVTFIYNYVSKVEGRSVVTYGANPFKDVKPTGAHKAYADAIQWAVDKGVTSGETSTTFAPDKTCTRAHIVTFLYNYFN